MIRFPLDHEEFHEQRAVCGVVDGLIAALTSIGIGADTAAIAAPVLLGAGGGALVSEVTGGNPLIGAVEGGFSGGLGELGPALGAATGIGTTAGDVLTSAAGGTLGAAVTGAPLASGAEGGALSGLVSGLTAGDPGASAPGTQSIPVAAPDSSVSSAGLPPSIAGPAIGAGTGVGPGAAAVSAPASVPSVGPDIASGGGVSLSSGGGADLPISGQGGAISIPGASAPLPSDISIPNLDVNVAGGASGGSSIMNAIHNPSFDTIGSAVGGNLGPIVAGGGLLLDFMRGNQPLPNQQNLQNEANQLATQGSQLESYLTTGTLPTGIQAGITQAAASAKASVRSQYASLGMTGSSAENQALSQIDSATTTQATNIALSLMQQGVSETQISSQLYTQLMNLALEQDQQLSQGIGAFSAALAGGGAQSLRLVTTGG